jgi:Pterin 4 alpha carbinolamine dehydratase
MDQDSISLTAPAGKPPSSDAFLSRVQRVLGSSTSRYRPKLKAERIQELVGQFPGWMPYEAGPGLVRVYRLPTVLDAGAFAAFAAGLLGGLHVMPEFEILGTLVSVRVATLKAPGEVSELDLEGREE